MDEEALAPNDSHQSLEEDMLKMLGNMSFSDMIFVCGATEEEVPASRMLVAARSPTLESMLLTSGMAETKLVRIPLPDLEASTMRICIEFLYTGAIRDNSWLGFLSSMKVISAARFFLVPTLEQLAIRHMTSSIHECVCDELSLEDVAKAYTYGVELQHHGHHMPLCYLMHELVACITLSSRWYLKCHEHLSEPALIHLLDDLDEEIGVNLAYVAFHLVIQWCSSKLVQLSDDPSINEQAIKNIFERFLPFSHDGVYKHIMMTTPHGNNPDEADMLRVLKLLADPAASILKKVNINFSNIPTLVLSKIIEPLGLVPCSMLLRAYRLQALRRPDLRWDETGHHKNYRISQSDLTKISCVSDDYKGFARCSLCVGKCSIISFSWEISILTPCEGLRVGFCKIQPGMSQEMYDKCLLGDNSWSWALSSDGCLIHNSQYVSSYCKPFQVQREVTVGVHLNMWDGSCSFSINGEILGVAWTALPRGERLYPAISMGKPGEVRIQMVFEDWMMNPESLLPGFTEEMCELQQE